MTNIISKMPESVEELMDIYSKYENKFKNDEDPEYSVDVLQNFAYSKNPITPQHQEYYHSKYNEGHYLMIFIFILSLIFYAIHFTGLYLILNLFGVDVFNKFLPRTLGITLFLGFYYIYAHFVGKISHKWNWKKFAIILVLAIGILSSLMIFINPTTPEMKITNNLEVEPYLTFLYGLFNIMAIAYAPVCLLVFFIYRSHSSITNYGGTHLFLGWIYRISETEGGGHLKVLNSSFHHLINELDNWLNETSKILIKNKNEILEGFYLNIISKAKFLENISKKHRDSFNDIFKGLLVENILKSKAFSNLTEEKEKKISRLDKGDLEYLKYRLSLTQIPKVINLIEKLSSKEVEVIFYSYSEKLKKIKSKIISFIVFMSTTLISFVLSLFA